jgi:regulatory protein
MDGPDTPAALKARALRHLARREHSRKELARKLAPHAASAAALEQLLEALAAKQQLSDERYAELRARQLSRKYGAARIRLDLRAKGVAQELVERVCAAGELERAAAILQRKYRGAAGSREERARRMRFLQQRGFSHETIRKLLSSDAAD